MIQSGSTITLEAWDAKFKPNLDWNHAWGAVPANMVTRGLWGIVPLAPGFGVAQIKPQTGGLTSSKIKVPTIRGSINCEFSTDNSTRFDLQVAVPSNMKTVIYIPVREIVNPVLLIGGQSCERDKKRKVFCGRNPAADNLASRLSMVESNLNSKNKFMMRYIFILLIASFLFSCNFNQTPKSDHLPKAVNGPTLDPEKLAQTKLTNAGDYREVLDRLDQGNLVSLDMAGTLFKNCVADSLTRDSMFVDFNDFYNTLAGAYLENNDVISTQLENSPSPEVLNHLKSSLAVYGILLNSSEGNYYLEPQTRYLLQNFGARLSPAYREYLTIECKEQEERFAKDGTILIPVDSLTSRIMTLEDFIARLSRFYLNEDGTGSVCSVPGRFFGRDG